VACSGTGLIIADRLNEGPHALSGLVNEQLVRQLSVTVETAEDIHRSIFAHDGGVLVQWTRAVATRLHDFPLLRHCVVKVQLTIDLTRRSVTAVQEHTLSIDARSVMRKFARLATASDFDLHPFGLNDLHLRGKGTQVLRILVLLEEVEVQHPHGVELTFSNVFASVYEKSKIVEFD
jgi:hypothetical protein